ncbi:MAG TPA: hypothetical protein VEA69_08515 [Tepidisphaeraceae bacterium]|nr:hypothetical protein [Tepidisphaeraceae bacterium]
MPLPPETSAGDDSPVLAYATPGPRRPWHRSPWGRVILFVGGVAAGAWAGVTLIVATQHLRGPVVSGVWLTAVYAYEAAYWGWATLGLTGLAAGLVALYRRLRRQGAVIAGAVAGLLLMAGFTLVRFLD